MSHRNVLLLVALNMVIWFDNDPDMDSKFYHDYCLLLSLLEYQVPR